jgi:hypothetical protein
MKIKIKYFPSKFTKCRLRENEKSAGSYDWKRDVSTGLATEGKWQTESNKDVADKDLGKWW